MTSDFHYRAQERDNDLVMGLCQHARYIRYDLREWAQAELNAILFEAQLLESKIEGMIGEQITEIVERLRTIDKTDLIEADRAYDDVIAQVKLGGYALFSEAYDELQAGATRLLNVMKELQKMREFIGEMGDS